MSEDDPFGLEDESEDEPTAEREGENTTVRQMREALERAKKRAEKAEQKGYEKAQRDFERQTKARELAEARGNPKLADLFLKANPEAETTEDAFKAFEEQYGLNPKAGGEEEEEEVGTKEPAPISAKPEIPDAAAFHGGGGEPYAPKLYTADEVRRIGLKDQAKALRIIADGQMAQAEP